MADWDIDAKGNCTLSTTPAAEAALHAFEGQFRQLRDAADEVADFYCMGGRKGQTLKDEVLYAEFEITADGIEEATFELILEPLYPHLLMAIEVTYGSSPGEKFFYGPAELVEDAKITSVVADVKALYASLSDSNQKKLAAALSNLRTPA